MSSASSAELPSRRQLVLATVVALVVALLVVVLFVMPAQFGKDPTGIGKLTGISKLYSAPEPPPSNTTLPPAKQLLRYNVTFPTQARSLAEETVSLQEGEEQTIDVQVLDGNLLDVTATLTWTDTALGPPGDPDLFQATWQRADGSMEQGVLGRNDAGGAGVFQAVAFIASPPRETTVDGVDALAASKTLKDRFPKDPASSGLWRLTIRLVDAPGALGATPDEANDVLVKVSSRSYEPALGAAFATGLVEDTLELVIDAQSRIEFKLRMDEGSPLTYDWSANTTLTYDFHGDRASDINNFTSHEQGQADGKAGDFVAPFTGRHGWFWRNDSSQPVTVTVHLTGKFAVIGVV